MLNWKRVLALVFWTSSVLASDSMIVRFDLTDSMKKFLKEYELDVTGVNYNTMEIEAHVTSEELAMLQAQRANFKFSYPERLTLNPDSDYKSPEEIEEFLRRTHAAYPDITQLRVIGKTIEGREILAIKISDNASVKETEPAILVNAMHHAREVMTPEITTDMIDYLTTNYGKKSDVTSWVNSTEIWVLPMLNLDGSNKVWDGSSMWRKNTRNGHGVDLNRNYPAGWNSCNGSSGRVHAQDYRGEAPASEPETKAMMDLVASIKPVFNISYHSYSELVIYPYGCRPKRTPAEEVVESIGKEMGKRLDYKPGTAWELLYNADGGDIDWMYSEHQVIPYVIEVNSTRQGFHPNYAKWRDVTVERNRTGWMLLLEKLQGPSLQGKVRKSDFEVIKISQAGSSKAFQTYKINPDGSYYVILNPGSYDISFEGTKKRTFENIQVRGKVSL